MNTPWPAVKLGEVLTPVERGEPVHPTTEYRLLGVRLDGRGPFLRETIQGSQSSATKLYRVAAGDFIYSRLFASRGAFGVIEPDLDGCYVSGEFPTFLPKCKRLDARFLRYWFRLATTLACVDENCAGSTPLTRNRFKEHFFLSLKIPLPPLPEQRRIVARIEELAAKIEEASELRSQVIEDSKSLVSSLHLHMAGGRLIRLDAILALDEIRENVLAGNQYPQVGVKGFGEGLFVKGAVDGSQTTYKAYNRLYAGAIVLSQVKGWEGAIAVCGPNFVGKYVSPEYRTFRCIPTEACPDYLAAIFSTPWFWSQLKDMTRGVGARRERIRPEHFLLMEIPMPTVNQQVWAIGLFARLNGLSALQAETAAELDPLLPSILDRAFKGAL